MNQEDTVYILDSYGLIFRCYFAFISRPLTNKNGQNVSALFGFFRNIHFILQNYKPRYIFAAMDSKTKTFRHQMYEQYKATRNKTPDDLHAQVPMICDILKILGIPVLQCDGYEADDIIATVVKKCEEQNRPCKILTGDKDLMQLVSKTTNVLKPDVNSTWKNIDIDGVIEQWGIPPKKMLDFLSLQGDSADNIPGVKGVGEKTAVKLLCDFDSLDGIYENIDKIKGALQKKLITEKENAYFSQKLVKLCSDVPCDFIDQALNSTEQKFDFSSTAKKLYEFDVPAVAKLFDSKLNPIENSSQKKEDNPFPKTNDEIPLEIKENKGNYTAFTKINELEQFISDFFKCSKNEKLIAFDCETDGLETLSSKIVGFSLCKKTGEAVYVPLQNEENDLFGQSEYILKNDAFVQLARLFCDLDTKIIFHNAKFDLKILYSNDFLSFIKIDEKIQTDFSFLEDRIIDTMICAWLINPERMGKNAYSLEKLGENILGLKGIEFSQIVEKGKTFLDVPLEIATPYASEDADFTFSLYKKFSELINENSKISNLFKLEMRILLILCQMEITGIHINSNFLNEYNDELSLGILKVEKKIYNEVGHEFNIASPKQLQTVLFEERKLKPSKKTKTGYSTDTSVLEELANEDEVPKMILEYRELAKLQSTYVETLPKLTDKNERIHTDFVQTGTATGRLACREPNLQNIPVRNDAGRKIRSAFTAPTGSVLISADYSQIELVVLAHISGDPKMCDAFNTGVDVHKATASLIFNVDAENVTSEMRRTAKTINFGVIYGMSAFRLAQDLGITRTQASIFIDNYFLTYSNVKDFINNSIQKAEETGIAQTIFGRKRPILNINSKNKVEKAAAERIAVNSQVQGSAADIVKKAMNDVYKELRIQKSPAKLLLQVHDELIFECPAEPIIIENTIKIIRDKMENAVNLKVPLKVSIEVGKNWGEFH